MTTLDVGGAAIAYRLDGPPEAPPLVLVNSLGADLAMWEPQVGALGERFRIVRFDLRGHGGSTATPAPYTLDVLGGDIVALLDAIGIARAHVIGISLGGMIATWLTARHPDRVDRAVLANTAARIGTAEVWQARADAVRSGGTDAVVDTVMQRFFSEAFRRERAEIVERFAEALRACSDEGYVGSCLALRDADLTADVPTIRRPVLVVAGGADVATPVTDAEWLHENVGGSRLVVLEGAGHLSSVECPRDFSDVARRFLDGEEVGIG